MYKPTVMKRLIALTFSVFFFYAPISAQSPCGGDAFRAFDFWIGEWRVETKDGNLAGHNHVKVILDSCVILENWTGAGRSRGKSFNHYDWQTKQWKQKWVDNFASNLEFTGTVKNDTAMYYCQSKNPQNGELIYNRMMIAKVTDDEVHQLWEQSKNNKDWSIAFDGKYIRTQSAASKDISSIYSTFSESYQTKNDSLLASLYTKDAYYLHGKGEMTKGRDKIRESFKGFFKSMADRNQDMQIQFKIVERRIEGDLAYDLGYYHLVYSDKNSKQATNESVGKFTTTIVKSEDGKWRFSSDSYTDAPISAFQKAVNITGQ